MSGNIGQPRKHILGIDPSSRCCDAREGASSTPSARVITKANCPTSLLDISELCISLWFELLDIAWYSCYAVLHAVLLGGESAHYEYSHNHTSQSVPRVSSREWKKNLLSPFVCSPPEADALRYQCAAIDTVRLFARMKHLILVGSYSSNSPPLPLQPHRLCIKALLPPFESIQ